MLRVTEKLHKVRRWSQRQPQPTSILVVLLVVVLFHQQPLVALAADKADPQQAPLAIPAIPAVEGRFLNDDLTISEGEIYDGDVVVYTGDVVVESGGAILGSLVVSSGDLTLESGSEVHGDVVAFSGDVAIEGHIGGDLAVWSGDIYLGEEAVIGGDVSLMNGEIEREAGATVGGSMVAGPEFPDLGPILERLELPVVPNAIEGVAPTAPAAPLPPNSWGATILRLIWRLLGAAVLTTLIVLTSGLAYYARPTFIHAVRATVNRQRPLSFGIGLAINLVLTLLIGVTFGTGSLLLTICLSPLGLVAGLLFFVINLGGWAALSLEVGERLLTRFAIVARPAIQLLAGALALTAPLTLAWALGSCFQPIGYFAMLALTTLGGGAVLVYQLKLGRGSADLAPSGAA